METQIFTHWAMGFAASALFCGRDYEDTMPRRPDSDVETVASIDHDEQYVVMAGPGTSLTIPGIIVSEIVMALAKSSPVRRIEVDLGTYSTMGLHRAPSLAAAHDVAFRLDLQRHRAPRNARARKQAFRQWIGPDAKVAIAYAWPGIGNEWIHEFLQVANAAKVPTVVVCASLPPSREARAVALVNTIRHADRVVVGDTAEANELIAAFGSFGPEVQTHRALSLTGRSRRTGPKQLTAFLPSESGETLTALMAAFDAIPEARINNYTLQVVMRYKGSAIESIIADSYHKRRVQLFGDDMSAGDLRELCDASSAISMADPALDSRAFSMAVNCGIATVVLANSKVPIVGRGYVGGLMADGRQPASIHVALTHALRLDELGFPSPDAWHGLAEHIIELPEPTRRFRTSRASSYVATPATRRFPELTHLLQPTVETG
jgi:hypothetical protein